MRPFIPKVKVWWFPISVKRFDSVKPCAWALAMIWTYPLLLCPRALCPSFVLLSTHTLEYVYPSKWRSSGLHYEAFSSVASWLVSVAYLWWRKTSQAGHSPRLTRASDTFWTEVFCQRDSPTGVVFYQSDSCRRLLGVLRLPVFCKIPLSAGISPTAHKISLKWREFIWFRFREDSKSHRSFKLQVLQQNASFNGTVTFSFLCWKQINEEDLTPSCPEHFLFSDHFPLFPDSESKSRVSSNAARKLRGEIWSRHCGGLSVNSSEIRELQSGIISSKCSWIQWACELLPCEVLVIMELVPQQETPPLMHISCLIMLLLFALLYQEIKLIFHPTWARKRELMKQVVQCMKLLWSFGRQARVF